MKRENKIESTVNSLDNLACRLFNLWGSWKYFKFSWSIQILNISAVSSKYCLYFAKVSTIASSSLL